MIDTDDVLVLFEHIHAAGFCSRGGRPWFARHGLDWGRMVIDGIPASVLDATGDALAHKVTEIARKAYGRQE